MRLAEHLTVLTFALGASNVWLVGVKTRRAPSRHLVGMRRSMVHTRDYVLYNKSVVWVTYWIKFLQVVQRTNTPLIP